MILSHVIKIGRALMAATQRPALQLPPWRAAQSAFKKRTISRAEGGQLQARVRRLARFQLDGWDFRLIEFNYVQHQEVAHGRRTKPD